MALLKFLYHGGKQGFEFANSYALHASCPLDIERSDKVYRSDL
jgi:hypothetical protein